MKIEAVQVFPWSLDTRLSICFVQRNRREREATFYSAVIRVTKREDLLIEVIIDYNGIQVSQGSKTANDLRHFECNTVLTLKETRENERQEQLPKASS